MPWTLNRRAIEPERDRESIIKSSQDDMSDPNLSITSWDDLSRMAENNLNQVRQSPLLSLSVYVVVAVLAAIGLLVLPDVGTKIIASCLFLAFGLAHKFLFQPADSTRKFAFYFVLQTLDIIALVWLFGGADVTNLLFFVLGVQALLVFQTRVAVAGLVLFYLISAISSFISHGANSLVGTLFNAAVFFFTGVFGYTLRRAELERGRNQQLLEELGAAQNQLNELAITKERNRLARDLHDSVKQHIFAASMQLGATRATLDDPPTARGHLDETESLIQQAQRELNTLIFELRPIALSEQSLATALSEYVRTWSRASNLTAEVEVVGEPDLTPAAEQALFRVAQESLANIARHSGANHVQVQLEYTPQETRLRIKDDGRGFQVAENFKGIGLDSMHERMAALGGALEIESEVGQGTCVTASVPERTTR